MSLRSWRKWFAKPENYARRIEEDRLRCVTPEGRARRRLRGAVYDGRVVKPPTCEDCGKPFPKEIVETGFDVENLLGVNALLNVQHEASREGRVYANVKAIMALPAGTAPLVAVDYVRKCDRTDAPVQGQAATTSAAPAPF